MNYHIKNGIGACFAGVGLAVIYLSYEETINVWWAILGWFMFFNGIDLYIDSRIERWLS